MANSNVFSRVWHAVRNRAAAESDYSTRSPNGQGAYTPLFNAFVPRTFQPELIEALREALPILDGLIDRLVTLDGVPVIVGEDAALVDEISAWAKNVQVNDVQTGLTAFSHAVRNEVHEQGFNLPEYVLSDNGRDVARLNVPDSKALRCGRDKDGKLEWYFNPMLSLTRGISDIQQVLESRQASSVSHTMYSGRASLFRKLDMSNKAYMAYTVENGDPYGVSRLRSMPFVAKTLLTIENGIANTHERFGDPSYHVDYKAAGRVAGDELINRKNALHNDFTTAINAKRDGKSSDFVTAVDKDSNVEIKVIGADGQTLSIEEPSRHLLEQIVGKGGVAAWLLGLHFSTSERLAKFQTEIMKQESDTRTNIEAEMLEGIVIQMLRARGRTWSDETTLLEDGRRVRKAWRIEFLKPNLADMVAQAQAKFMNAQADAVRANAGVDAADTAATVAASTGQDNAQADDSTAQAGDAILAAALKAAHQQTNHTHAHHNQDIVALETRPLDNPALDTIEKDALKGVFAEWDTTTSHILRSLGLASTNDPSNAMIGEGFTFTQADKDMIANEVASFVTNILENEGLSQGVLAQAYIRAWALGVIDGYTRSGLNQPSGEMNNDAAVSQLLKTSNQEFATFIDNKLTPRIHRVLEAGAAAGENPINIAANLKREMGGATWKLEQIARSEIAMAWDDAKRGEWQAEIADGAIDDLFDFIPAPDGCPQCQGQAVGNPRKLSATPKPVVDTHPSCRCDVAPHI